MERLPGESCNHYHGRLVEAIRAQRRSDLLAARLEAERTGKQPFDCATFGQAYHAVRPYLPDCEEMEAEYYLDYRSVRNLDEFMQALLQADLYDGSDMRLDP